MRTSRLASAALVACGMAGSVAADLSGLLYHPVRVVEIAIQAEPNEWDALCAQQRTFVSLFHGACFAQPFGSPFTWFRGQITIDGKSRENVGIRKKGFLGSLDSVRPSLKIDLDKFQDNDAIYDTKRLTLNNAKQDPSLIRQCLGYLLFMRAGVPAPRCNFAHLTINGRDLGIFANVEDVRKPMLARYFHDISGNLYEGTVSDFHPLLVNTFEAQTNEKKNDRADLDAVIAVLDANDGELLPKLGALIDLDAFITFWAMEALVGHWDGYSSNRNNFYVYRDPASNRFHFIPWGVDTIFADGYPIASLDPAANKAAFAYSAITRRLVDLPEVRSRYIATMRTLLDTVWNEAAIFAEIERMERLLAPFAGNLAEATAPVRSFVLGQRARIEESLAGGLPEFPPLTIIDLCLVRNGSVSGNFVATWDTAGTVPPFLTGAAITYGKSGGTRFAALNGGADAGLGVVNPNGYLGFLNLYFRLVDGSVAALSATVDPHLLLPQAQLPIDGRNVDGLLVFLDGKTEAGYLDQGTLTLVEASPTPGGMICGRFEAGLYVFSGAVLTGSARTLPPRTAAGSHLLEASSPAATSAFRDSWPLCYTHN